VDGMMFDKELIVVRKLASGDELTIPVFKFNSNKKGKKVFIMANMHGAEVQSNLVAFKLIEFFSQSEFTGEVIIVPTANPYGLNHKAGEYTQGRFDPFNGKNYNRNYFDLSLNEKELKDFLQKNENKDELEISLAFKKALDLKISCLEKQNKQRGLDYGDQLCLKLQRLSFDADVLIDLHTASNAVNHLYAPIHTAGVVEQLQIENIIWTQNEFAGAMDEAHFVPWLNLWKVLGQKELPNLSFTVECGSQERVCEISAKKIFNGVLNLLEKIQVHTFKQEYHPDVAFFKAGVEKYRSIFSTDAGVYSSSVSPGDFVIKGQVLGHFYQFKKLDSNISKTTLLSPYNGRIINQTDSAVIHESTEVYRLLESIDSPA
jgi:hypothetical protein